MKCPPVKSRPKLNSLPKLPHLETDPHPLHRKPRFEPKPILKLALQMGAVVRMEVD